MTREEEIAKALPCYVNRCGGYLVERHGKHGTFFGCTNYPTCTATMKSSTAHEAIAANVFGEHGDQDEPRYDKW
jgi:ssDNA-binding Zn-finger/Zn-ribbon topoisomerase 1